jgi:hypothetical protein
MTTRRLPAPTLPAAPPLLTMVAIAVITLMLMLYAVSIFGTSTFDAGILMTEPGERIRIIMSYATAMWRMITDPVTTGKTMPCCQQGVNTAHPLVTLGIGGALALLPSSIATAVASAATALAFAAAAVYFIRRYRSWRWNLPLVAYVLVHPAVYEELRNPSLLPIKFAAIAALVVMAERKRDDIISGICWFAALLFDPLLMLLILPLILARRFRVIGVGLALYLLATIPYLVFPMGASYRQVLIDTVVFPAGAYTVASIARFMAMPTVILWIPILAVSLCLVYLQLRKRLPLGPMLAVWTILVTAVSGDTIPSSYLIVPILVTALISVRDIVVTPFLFSAMIAMVIPSPVLWFRIGAYGSLLSSRDIGIAAVWTAYWSLAVGIGLLVGLRSGTIRRTEK